MGDRRQNQAMQRFFEFVFNVPGDCFCFTWSISCFLETVEHMEGDKRWRSICSLGMATVTLGIIFLLSLSLCPIYYWSEIDEIIPFNQTKIVVTLNGNTNIDINYNSNNNDEYYDYISQMSPITPIDSSNSLYTTTNLPSTETTLANSYFTTLINEQLASNANNNHQNTQNATANNLTWEYEVEQHKSLNLNLWHIQFCEKNHTNISLYRNIVNTTINGGGNTDDSKFNRSKRSLMNREYLTYAEILALEATDKKKHNNKHKNSNSKSNLNANNIEIFEKSTIFESLVNAANLWLNTFKTDNKHSNSHNNKHNYEVSFRSASKVTSKKNRILVNTSYFVTNETCQIMSYDDYDATSTQQLSLWFIVLVILLLIACFVCLICSHPIFDRCHYGDENSNNRNNRNNNNNGSDRNNGNNNDSSNNRNSNDIVVASNNRSINNSDFPNVAAGGSLSIQNSSINDGSNNNVNNINSNPLLGGINDDFINDYSNINENNENNNGNNNNVDGDNNVDNVNNQDNNNNDNNENNNINIHNNVNNNNSSNNSANDTLRSSIQKLLAFAITILCACILNWSSFVFAAVYEAEREKYSEEIQDNNITQSNLGTGMLSVNLAMLLTIILAVIHCGSPQRVPPSNNNNNNNNNIQNNQDNQNNQNNQNNANIDNINDNNNANANENGGNDNSGIDSDLRRAINDSLIEQGLISNPNINGNHGNNGNNQNNNRDSNNNSNVNDNNSNKNAVTNEENFMNNSFSNNNGSGYLLECDIPSNESPVSPVSSNGSENILYTSKKSNSSTAPAAVECKDENSAQITLEMQNDYESYEMMNDSNKNSKNTSKHRNLKNMKSININISKNDTESKKTSLLASLAGTEDSDKNIKEKDNKTVEKKGLKSKFSLKKKSGKDGKTSKDMDYEMIVTDNESNDEN